MAYAAAVTVVEVSRQGDRRTFFIAVSETEAAATSEWTTAGTGSSTLAAGGVLAGGLPTILTIVARKVYKVSGTGTTYAPIWARATGAIAAGTAHYLDGFTAAAYIDDQSRVTRRLNAGNIYGRSGVNAGTDNSIVTEMIVVAGAL